MSQEDGPTLPPSLTHALSQFSPESGEITLPVEDLNDENIRQFLIELFKKYEDSPQHLNKLIHLKLIGEKDLQLAQQNILSKELNNALKDKFNALYEQSQNQEALKKGPKKSLEVSESDGFGIFANKIKTHITLSDLSDNEERLKNVLNAFELSIKSQFETAIKISSLRIPPSPPLPAPFRTRAIEAKTEKILKEVKNSFEASGLEKPVSQRPQDRGSLFKHMLEYSKSSGIASGGTGGAYEQALEEEIFEKYQSYVWPLVQKEAFNEYEAAYKVKKKEPLDDFFNELYAAYYEKDLKKKMVGPLDLLPKTYTVHISEMMKSCLKFLEVGGFQNTLGEASLSIPCPSGRLPNMTYDFSEIMQPLIEHAKNGRPLPFNTLYVKHLFECKNFYNDLVEFAKAIADKPGDYYHLESLSLDPALMIADKNPNVDEYEAYLEKMIKLAQRQPNGLAAQVKLTNLAKKINAKLQDDIEKSPENKSKIEERINNIKAKEDKLNLLVAQNRRAINSSLLYKGAIGAATLIEVSAGKVVQTQDRDKIRACKRIQDLESALGNIATEQEAEQEKEKEKEQEKEQEQEQEKEMEKAHGSAEDNLSSEEEFVNFALSQRPDLSHKQNELINLWNNVFSTSPLRAMSKDVARLLLNNPDAFQYGLVEGNLPEGFHIGNLTLKTSKGEIISKKGIYYDISLQNDINPLTVSIKAPPPKRTRLQVSSADFTLEHKPTTLDPFTQSIVKNAFTPLTSEEIINFNSGKLDESNDDAPLKMIFMTSTEGALKFTNWLQGSITKKILETNRNQELADIAVAFGGDALFKLTDHLSQIKERCEKTKPKEIKEIFDKFLDTVILQNGQTCILERPKLIDHLMQYDQFQALKKIGSLPDEELSWFMTFCCEHAKHNSLVDIHDLYLGFKEFVKQYKALTNEAPLPPPENLVKECKNMKVGLDRILFVLNNAKKNNLLQDQLAVLEGVDLHYNAAYQATKEHHYRIVLPEMVVSQAKLSKEPLLTANNINNVHSRALSAYEGSVTDNPIAILDARRAFFCHYALAKTAPSLSDIREIDKFILDIKHPPYNCSPEKIQASLYALISFCLYHDKGIGDSANVEKLQALAQSIDNTLKKAPNAISFLVDIAACQQHHFFSGKGDPPTLDSLNSYMTTMLRLHSSGVFKKFDPLRLTITSAFDAQRHYENNQDLFEPIHKIHVNKNLSDDNLAYTLISIQDMAFNYPRKQKEADKLSTIKGNLLQALALIADPGVNFCDKASPESLDAFIKNCLDNYCGDDNQVAFRAIENLLKVIRFSKLEPQKQAPTWSQLKDLINKASANPQESPADLVKWIKTQPGFADISFDLSTIQPVSVKAQTFKEAFIGAEDELINALSKFDIHIAKGSCQNFDEFLLKLKELNVEKENAFPLLIFPLLKEFIYKANHSALNHITENHLKQLTAFDQKNISQMAEIYKPESIEPKSIDGLVDLSTQYAKHHAKLSALYGEISQAQNYLKKNFSEVSTLLGTINKESISIEHLTQLLTILNQHRQTADIFPIGILKKALGTKEKISNWDTLNKVLEKTLLPQQKINQEKLFELSLLLSSKDALSFDSIQSLVALSQKNLSIYEQTAELLTKQIKQNHVFDISLTSNQVAKLLNQGVDEKDILSLLKHLSDNKYIDKSSAILNELHAIEDKEKLSAITSILSLSFAQTTSPSMDMIKGAIENLKNLDAAQLTSLSKMDLDAPFPNVQQLYNDKKAIKPEEFIQDLQASFFKLKNDDKELAIIFNDDRVIPVLNASSILNFKKAIGLPLSEKEQLLKDYAYIHAIGLNKPVYDNKPLKDLPKDKLLAFQKELIQKMQDKGLSDKQMKLATLQYIALMREIYYRATFDTNPNKDPPHPRGKFPFSTQIISLLQALAHPEMNINEIATGQGKSLTAALYASLLSAQGKPAIICTSNPTLANEGLEENHAFYKYMGIPTSVIEADSSSKDFQLRGINYTDVSNFALFLAKTDVDPNNPLDLKNPALVLDEVDFTVLDEVTDFRYAVSLEQEGLSEISLDEWLYYQINAFVDSDKFLGQQVTRESDVVNAILALDKQLDLAIKDKSLKDPQLSHIKKRLAEFKIQGSEGRKQLDTWIDSAFNAKIIYEKGQGTAWTLEKYSHKDGNEYSAARIISHHRVSKGAKWSKGVHQFLHARINEKMVPTQGILPCRIDSEKLHVAALTSKNFIDYFTKRGGSVWGITGTIGSAEERAELIQKYGFFLTQIETHQERKANKLDPIFAGSAKGHVDALLGQYKKHAMDKNQMPTVIVEEDAEYAKVLKENFLKGLEKQAKNVADPPLFQYYDGINYQIYEFNKEKGKYILQDQKTDRNDVEKESAVKRQAGSQNTITLTTPLMGRGTDFKPVDKKGNTHPDGLFVIGAYAESSEREERQIIGRMGRQGQPGLFINIVDKTRFIKKLEAEGISVPPSVRYFQPHKLEKKLGTYKEAKNMSLAKNRQFKQTYGDIRGYFYYNFISMLDLADPNKKLNELLALVKPSDPDNFSKQFKTNLLSCWNQYLTALDRKYIKLKDKYPGDYDKIFSKLNEYASTQWNDTVVNKIRDQCGLKADDDNANILFLNHQVFTKPEPYIDIRKKQDQKKGVPVASDESYLKEFADVNTNSIINTIIQKGKPAIAKDPSETYQVKPISDLVINYPKYVFMQDPIPLTELSPVDAKRAIAQFLAVDLLNNLHRLNGAIEHDKHLALRPIPINLEEIMKNIDADPIQAYESLLKEYHKLSFQAQALTQERDPSNKFYHDLHAANIAKEERIYKALRKAPFTAPVPFEDLALTSKTVGETMLEEVRFDLFLARRKNNPLQAIRYQNEYKGTNKFPPYELEAIKQDIQRDIEGYLKNKSKQFSRSTEAKNLLKEIKEASSHDQILACLLAARKLAVSNDLKSTTLIGERHQKGSRFHSLLDKSMSRMLLNAKTKNETFKIAHILKDSLLEQLNYIQEHAKVNVDDFKAKLKNGDLTLEQMIKLKEQLSTINTQVRTLPDKEAVKAKIDFQLLDNSLQVMAALLDKMIVLKVDLSEKVYQIPQDLKAVQPADFTSRSSSLFQSKILMDQLSSHVNNANAKGTFLMSHSPFKGREQKLVDKIVAFSSALIQDVQLSNLERFEIMRGFLFALKKERHDNKPEALFIEKLVSSTRNEERACCNTTYPKEDEDCHKTYTNYKPPDFKPLAIEKPKVR